MGYRKNFLTLAFVMSLSLVLQGISADVFAGSIHTKRATHASLKILRENLQMSEAISILELSFSKNKIQKYLSNINAKFIGSQKQGKVTVYGYSINDLSAPIIGYSLFFYGETGPLIIVDAAVNPLNKKAVNKVVELSQNSLDSNRASDGTTLYFLGILDLNSDNVVKLMLREATISSTSDYAIRYAISGK